MKKIGIMAKPIEQGFSGSGSHLEQLVENLMRINDKFEIILLHYGDSNKEIFNKYKSIKIPTNPLLASLKLRKLNFDIIHYSPLTIKSPLYFVNAIKVATVHGGASFLLREQYSFIHNFHADFIRPILMRKMKSIFTVSKTSMELINKYDEYPLNNINITYNAVSDCFYNESLALEYLTKKFSINCPYVFHISRFSERKNPWGILNAFKLLVAKKTEHKLIIAGKGWDNDDVNSFLHKNGLLQSVIRLGFVDNVSLRYLYSGADVFLFPSLFEGCGMPNLEAMACECPVVTSSSFAIPEIVGDGAVVVDNFTNAESLSEAISNIIDNPAFKKDLVNRGIRRAKLYSWGESAKTVLDTYSNLLTNK